MKKMRKLGILCLCVLTVLLSACSYREFEDSLKSKLNNEDEDEYVNPATIPGNSSETGGGPYSVGDTIAFTDVFNRTVEYTLHQAHISDSIKDVGLNVVDFDDPSLIKDNGDIDKGNRLVTVDITVKNIDYVEDDPEGDETILPMEVSAGFKDDIEDPNGPFLLYASYFSEHPPLDQNNGQDYYFFPLAIGEKKRVTVGWFVPADRLEKEPLYYVIGEGGRSEYFRYFNLNFDEGANNNE